MIRFLESWGCFFRGMGTPQTYCVGDIIEPSRMLHKLALPFLLHIRKSRNEQKKNCRCDAPSFATIAQEVGNPAHFSPG